jgi:predicted branched-subunit amino acid permease
VVTTTAELRRGSARTNRAEAARGAAEAVPLLVGYAPFAFVVGNAIADHASPAAGWAGIWLVISGSALLATLQALDAGPAVIAAVTGLIVNARLAVYSASMRTPWSTQPRWFRVVAALLLIDPTWAIADRRTHAPGTDAQRRAHYLGAAITLLVGWATMITGGVLVGSGASPLLSPGAVNLRVAVPLCLVVLVAPRLGDPSSRTTVLAVAAVAVVSLSWQAGTGMLLAIAVGAVSGALQPGAAPHLTAHPTTHQTREDAS